MRLLYDARVTAGDGGTTRFRLAVACRLPDRLRLEALGPAGGTRLVIATDGAEATALLVADRRWDRAPATPEGLERWTGLPLGASDLGAILQGKPPCGGRVSAASGSTSPVDIRCDVDAGEEWARQVTASVPSGARRIELRLVGEAAPARLDDRLFAPEIPPGFERSDRAMVESTWDSTLFDGKGGGP